MDNNPTIPASTPIGRACLEGWCGPVLVSVEDHEAGEMVDTPAVAIYGADLFGAEDPVLAGWSIAYRDEVRDVRLPLPRPEVRLRLADVLGRGVRCCPGEGRACDCNGGAPTADGSRAKGAHDEGCRSLGPPLCATCGDTGYHIAPHDVRHLLDGPLGTPALTAEQSAILLAAHVASLERGGRGIVGVLGAWKEWTSTRRHRGGVDRKAVSGRGGCHVAWNRWYVTTDAAVTGERDHRTHPDEQSWEAWATVQADTEALTRGLALLDADGSVRVPS